MSKKRKKKKQKKASTPIIVYNHIYIHDNTSKSTLEENKKMDNVQDITKIVLNLMQIISGLYMALQVILHVLG